MDLQLKNIYCHGDDNLMVYISLEANYGWEGKMCRDIIRVNYNGKKRESFITIKLKNPGIGTIIERLVQFIAKIDFSSEAIINPPLLVLEQLAEKFNLTYDPDMVVDAMEKFTASVKHRAVEQSGGTHELND